MRYEYKYFVPVMHMNRLREMIQPFCDLDIYAEGMENDSYQVRSIYFDTPYLDYYTEKVEGIKHRKKLRLRGYNDGGEESMTFLEIKRKYEDPIRKYRTPLTYHTAKMLLSEGGDLEALVHNSKRYPNAVDNARRFFYHLYRAHLQPVVLVVYEREPWLGKWDPSIRITFDKNLCSSAFPTIDGLFDNRNLRPALGDFFILEVKFNRYFPAWMKPVIGLLGLKRESASKYVISMDTHRMNKYSSNDILAYATWKQTHHTSGSHTQKENGKKTNINL